jgi:hypothetical protein
MEKLVEFLVSPLYEHLVAQQELALPSQLLEHLNQLRRRFVSTEDAVWRVNLQETLAAVQEFIERAVKLGIRDVTSLVGYQDLFLFGQQFGFGNFFFNGRIQNECQSL